MSMALSARKILLCSSQELTDFLQGKPACQLSLVLKTSECKSLCSLQCWKDALKEHLSQGHRDTCGPYCTVVESWSCAPSTRPRGHLLHQWQGSWGKCLTLPQWHLQVAWEKQKRPQQSWRSCQETSLPFRQRAVHLEASEWFQYETSYQMKKNSN